MIRAYYDPDTMVAPPVWRPNLLARRADAIA
jgi:hypothetical protein